MFSNRYGALLVILLFFLSCSVKEDRDNCPCTISLNLDRLPAVVTVRDEGETVILQSVATESPLTLKVPHGCLGLSFGAMDAPDDLSAAEVFGADGAVRIERGEECPKIWLEHCESLDTSSEYVSLSPVMHRSFAILKVIIVHPYGETVPYDVGIEGEVDGYKPDCTPSSGEFGVRLSPDESLSCSLSLPRQRDNSLMLHIMAGESILRTFALGETLCRNGYDWGAPDLSDIEVEINYRFSQITVTTDLWSVSVPLEIVI